MKNITDKEIAKMERKAKETEERVKSLSRKAKSEQRKIRVSGDLNYMLIYNIAKYMDKYCLDPIIGFLIPGGGDILTSVMTIPYISVAAFTIRSLPLTLAVIYNMLIDMLIGSIPFFIGDICDVFHRSYSKNYELIVGFVEGDEYVIESVNEKAVKTGIFIVVLCVLIYLMMTLVISAVSGIWDFIINLFN